MELNDEYRNDTTIIRSFYKALENGQGNIASSYIVPEKRSVPAFNESNLSRFYGSLAEPIQLLDISANENHSYTVTYTYATKSRQCNGTAIINTDNRDGINFIKSIKSLNGC